MSNIVILGTIQEHMCKLFDDKNNHITVVSKKLTHFKNQNVQCISEQKRECNYVYVEALGNTIDTYVLIHADDIYLSIGEKLMKETLTYLKTALEMRMKVNAYQPLQLYYDDIDKSQVEVQIKKETTKEFDMWFDAYVVLQKYNKLF